MTLCSSLVEEGPKEHLFCYLRFLSQQGDVVLPKLYRLASLPEGMKDSSQLRFSNSHTSYYLLFAELGPWRYLPWRYRSVSHLSGCNCPIINPLINSICHPKTGFILMQLCGWDYPVYCIYKCLLIYFTET